MWVPRYFDRSYWTERFWPSGAGGSGSSGTATVVPVTAEATNGVTRAAGWTRREILRAAEEKWRAPGTATVRPVEASARVIEGWATGAARVRVEAVRGHASVARATAATDPVVMARNDEELLLLLDVL